MDRISGFGPEDLGSIPSRLVEVKMDSKSKKYLAALSVLIGTCVGAGILGIPYVTSKSGFYVTIFYLVFLGGIVLLINLYIGETVLRTKQPHQLSGYARKYVGKWAGRLIDFALVFGIYAAIVAYLKGVGDSLSFILTGSLIYGVPFGILFGVFMSFLLWKGTSALKKYEKYGVIAILAIISGIFFFFILKISYSNLNYFSLGNFMIPFGVVLFALESAQAIPEISLVLRKDKISIKKVIISGSIISFFLYLIFTFIVIGITGINAPEIATFALGPVFVIFGIFTMFSAHFSLGNALEENFQLDDRFRKLKSWILVSAVPILIYVLLSFFQFFSFTKILSIGGVVSGGIISILSLFVIKGAKEKGELKPEYSVPLNWFVIIFISLVFIIGVLWELLIGIVKL